MLIIHPVEKFLLRLLSKCSFYSLLTPFSSFLVTFRSAYAHLLHGFLFPFLCSLRGQCQQFCHPLTSSAVSSRCDLYLNCLRAAHALSSSFTSLPWVLPGIIPVSSMEAPHWQRPTQEVNGSSGVQLLFGHSKAAAQPGLQSPLVWGHQL